MDFLKSAVASAMSKGPPFPYSFGDRVDIEQSIWTLNNGTKREDSSNCSIFSFNVAADKARLSLARNALKKLRTLRHPGVIRVLDTVETDTYIYIATERVVPLRWHVKRKSLSPETIKWGLYGIARTVKFINNDAMSIHGNIKVASIYTSESGEWKLGGFELVSNVKDDEAVIYTYGSLSPDSARYAPPEIARSGWDAIKSNPHSAVDSFAYGALIFEAFNGEYLGADQAGQTRNLPPSMHASYRRLVNAAPKARLSVAHFLEQGQRAGFFFDIPLIKLTEGVDNLGVKTPKERDAFLSGLDQLSDDIPEDFFKMKILPELLKSVEYGGGGPKALAVVLKIAAKLSSEEFDARITPVIVRLFAIPDRAMRVSLLDSLPLMINRLTQKTVNDKIFPQIVTGFTDSAPVVREQTLKSVLVIVSKLSERTISGDLLRHLAKTANDEQPGIRTNTTICMGRLARSLSPSTRAKVLLAAFLRSLHDPFVHARNAALMALAVTVEYFSEDECACRILPALCPLLLDKEKLVRDQATKTMDTYLAKVRKVGAAMPDSALPPGQAAEGGNEAGTAQPRMSTPQPADGAASSWAGWAISSFTNKISAASGEMEPGSAGKQGPASGLGLNTLNTKKPVTSSSASTLHRQAVASPAPSVSRTSSGTAAAVAAAAAAAAELFGDNDVGNDDVDDAGWGDFGDDAIDEDDGKARGGNGVDEAQEADAGAVARESAALMSVGVKTATASRLGDDGEPDFAGWLAAQAQKKKMSTAAKKVLPKGLVRSGTSASNGKSNGKMAGQKPAAAAAAAAPVADKPAKKIDLKPKNTDDDDDGWGDAW